MKKVFKMAIIAVMILCMGLCITTIVPTPRVETAYAAVYQQGSTGSVVKTMQQKLKNWGYYTGSVDGIFGAKTREAVKYFQRKNARTLR